MMLVDTDVLIWNLRGNRKAAERLDNLPGFALSAVSYMELVQGARDSRELQLIRQSLTFWSARLVQIDESISNRAIYLVEQHSLANSLQLADALIASTALELGIDLLTANDKHYRMIDNLVIEIFRP